jgi:hypothetical protein
LKRLNLTEDEGAVVKFFDEEEDATLPTMEWALVGKVISPMAVHVNTVCAAMKPTWGNPIGLKTHTSCCLHYSSSQWTGVLSGEPNGWGL